MGYRVKDIMVTDVVTVEGGVPLLKALDLMYAKKVKSLVVLPRNESEPYGMLTFTDVARHVVVPGEQIELLNVFDVMQKPAISVSKEWDIKYAAKLLTDLGINRALVTNGNRLEGLISLTDIVRSLMTKPE
jgi:CBS domain-containing protein